ncbi:MAG: mechanosensitive ion channel domain-containing protein [Pseudomonadota bacterium]
MEADLSLFQQYFIPWAIKIAVALTIFVVGKILAGYVTTIVTKLMVRARLDEMLVQFLHNLLYVVLLGVVVLAAIDQLGVSITSVLAIIGAAGLAVGLALKDSLSNFAAGVMIIVFRPFKIGDTITTTGNWTGVVDEIGMFCTLMHTFDNQRVIIPNSAVISGTIINSSSFLTRRIDLLFQVGYATNIGDAKKAIESVVSSEARLLKEPATSFGVDQLGNNTITLFVRAWVRSNEYGDVRTELLERIKTALDAAGISFLPPAAPPVPPAAPALPTIAQPPAETK